MNASTIRRGEIWMIDLNPTLGSELNKRRPGLVVSSNHLGVLPVKIVVPLTEWQDSFNEKTWHVPIEPTPQNGLSKKSSADAMQVRTVSTIRFSSRLGMATPAQIDEVALAIAAVIEMPSARSEPANN